MSFLIANILNNYANINNKDFLYDINNICLFSENLFRFTELTIINQFSCDDNTRINLLEDLKWALETLLIRINNGSIKQCLKYTDNDANIYPQD